MLLQSEGSPEEGHDSVAHGLVDGPLVTVDGLHHALEDRVEHGARFLGIMAGDQGPSIL